VVVVVFTMLLVTASTMAMTIRERLREVAILKSLGYPARTVLLLLLGEAAFISILGGIVGCAFALILTHTDLSLMTGRFIRSFTVRPATYGGALGAGAAIGMAAAIVPAMLASRMTITEAMRRLD
jgi:putative ABC transport system permease protein